MLDAEFCQYHYTIVDELEEEEQVEEEQAVLDDERISDLMERLQHFTV